MHGYRPDTHRYAQICTDIDLIHTDTSRYLRICTEMNHECLFRYALALSLHALFPCTISMHYLKQFLQISIYARIFFRYIRILTDTDLVNLNMNKYTQICYEHGTCDRDGELGSGSLLFYINSWGMIWPTGHVIAPT